VTKKKSTHRYRFNDFIAGFGFGVGRVPLVAAITGGEDEGVVIIYLKKETQR
jgi:hypothetical protein